MDGRTELTPTRRAYATSALIVALVISGCAPSIDKAWKAATVTQPAARAWILGTWEGGHADATMAFGWSMQEDRTRFHFEEEGDLVKWIMTRYAVIDGRRTNYEAVGY